MLLESLVGCLNLGFGVFTADGLHTYTAVIPIVINTVIVYSAVDALRAVLVWDPVVVDGMGAGITGWER